MENPNILNMGWKDSTLLLLLIYTDGVYSKGGSEYWSEDYDTCRLNFLFSPDYPTLIPIPFPSPSPLLYPSPLTLSRSHPSTPSLPLPALYPSPTLFPSPSLPFTAPLPFPAPIPIPEPSSFSTPLPFPDTFITFPNTSNLPHPSIVP